jgi:hypothetical protein
VRTSRESGRLRQAVACMRKENEAINERPRIGTRKGNRRRGRPRHTWRRSVHNEALENGKGWSEVKRLARNRTRWPCFVDTLCPLRDNRN